MNETQRMKRNFRQSKVWKEFKKRMWMKCGKLDGITLHPIRKTASLHHRNLDETQYKNLREDWFLPCNNLTHKFIHWLYVYYIKDPAIIDRIKAELEKMAEINRQE